MDKQERVPRREAGSLIGRIHQIAGRVFSRLLRESGLEDISAGQGRIIYELWKGDGVSAKDLSAKTGLEKSTLSVMLDRLEGEGKIVRKRDFNDRRLMLVFLSAESRERRNSFSDVSLKMDSIYFSGFTEKESASLEKYLERVLRNLENAEKPQSEEREVL